MAEKSDKLKSMSEEELDARHAEKMKKKKAAR
ncbi:MAG: cob(I)yrinic acid a,c-diamide adenosyltransferase, partial [Nitratireductor sp.]|nr:cob(I)yrinic acid a,c-diamide adenosyltransferase [Nitratireductor sp.]